EGLLDLLGLSAERTRIDLELGQEPVESLDQRRARAVVREALRHPGAHEEDRYRDGPADPLNEQGSRDPADHPVLQDPGLRRLEHLENGRVLTGERDPYLLWGLLLGDRALLLFHLSVAGRVGNDPFEP